MKYSLILIAIASIFAMAIIGLIKHITCDQITIFWALMLFIHIFSFLTTMVGAIVVGIREMEGDNKKDDNKNK